MLSLVVMRIGVVIGIVSANVIGIVVVIDSVVFAIGIVLLVVSL